MSFVYICTGHNISADYWSFGILIYELLTKTTPFYAANDMEIYEGILNGIEGVRFSRKVGKHAEVRRYALNIYISVQTVIEITL